MVHNSTVRPFYVRKIETFYPIEHIIPESLWNKCYILHKIVCDDCNSYFSKLENYFIHHHHTSTNRLFSVSETKKGKPPKQKLQYGEVRKEKEGRIILTQNNYESPEDQFRITFLADNIEISASYPLPATDTKKISRALAKFALEILYYKNGDIAFSSEFDPLRQYARYGKAISFIPYLWNYQNIKELDIYLVEIKINAMPECFYYSKILIPGSVYFIPCHKFTEMKIFETISERFKLNKVLLPEIINRAPIKISVVGK